MAHKLSLPWDVSESSAEIYVLSIIEVLGIVPPVSIIVECPTWGWNIEISEESTIKKESPKSSPKCPPDGEKV